MFHVNPSGSANLISKPKYKTVLPTNETKQYLEQFRI